MVLLPSGMGEPEETLAAIWWARRLRPVPWSPSSRLRLAREMRWLQNQRVGWDESSARLVWSIGPEVDGSADADAVPGADAVPFADARSAATVWIDS